MNPARGSHGIDVESVRRQAERFRKSVEHARINRFRGDGTASRGNAASSTAYVSRIPEELASRLRRLSRGELAVESVGGTQALARIPEVYAPLFQGFACVDRVETRRTLVNHREELAHALANQGRVALGRPLFLSTFSFTQDFARYVSLSGGSTAGYQGVHHADLLTADIDCKRLDGTGDIEAALQAARKFAAVLLACGVPPEALHLFFSGSKGFHAQLPASLCGALPSPWFSKTTEVFMGALADVAECTLDASIYRPSQPLRAPNSLNEKSLLYKRPLTLDQFLDLTATEIQRLAAAPCAVVVQPVWWEPVPFLAELWQASETAVVRRLCHSGRGSNAAIEVDINESFALSDRTWDFIRNGAPSGQRANELFAAAADLADCGSLSALVHAILARAVSRIQLPWREAQGHIERAIVRATQNRQARLAEVGRPNGGDV